MRASGLAIAAIHVGLASAAFAQSPVGPSRSIAERLPLFDTNHCETHKDTANQLFCADPGLIKAAPRLSAAIQDRLDRIPDKLLAVEENAQWIRNRNLSCGIFGQQPIRAVDIDAVVLCLAKETEERIELLHNPDFDCLAVDTAAGALICSDPSLAEASEELGKSILKLTAKLNENEAKDAFAEYARWMRDRDRDCKLDGKDNVPLDELAPFEACLSAFMKRKEAEIASTNGDPKKLFGRRTFSPLPNADAVDLCVAQVQSINACGDFVRIDRVFEIDNDVTDRSAVVTAEVEMIVLSPFGTCSPIASNCTGTCWDAKTGKPESTPDNRGTFPVSHRIRIEKAFTFNKADTGGWRCNATALLPIDFGIAFGGPR